MLHTLAIGMPGPFEWMIIAGLGLLIFGKRLPEVGRSLGKGIVEFKRVLKSVEDEVSMVDDDDVRDEPRKQIRDKSSEDKSSEHKFDPYTGKPLDETKETSSSSKDTHD